MDADQTHLQLYILEYQKAAEQYENIYRSIWTIFSYLTAVAAGFLAFGSDRIEWHALICVAAIPLLFWFWTTYLPLDRYGHEALDRLADIERLLNSRFQTQLNHFTHFAHPLSVRDGVKRAFKAKQWGDLWYQVRRARFAICLFFFLLHVLVIWQMILSWRSCEPLFREKAAPATPVGRPQ